MILDQEKKVKKVKVFISQYGKVCSFLLLLVFSIVLISGIYFLISPKKLVVSFLDIGQGDAILVQTPSGHDILIDGGPSDRVLEKLSQKMNYFDRHLDIVLSTHPDADHVTGLISVFKKYKVDTVIVSPALAHTGVFDVLEKSILDEGSTIYQGTQGDMFTFGDGVVMQILYPYAGLTREIQDTNSYSVSILVSYEDESILLTGDLPSVSEKYLLQDVLPHQVTIYKAGHHGSKYSSGEQLLSYIRPEYAVVSAGKNNKYGHPNNETLERLKKYAHQTISTIESGTISFVLNGTSIMVTTEK
jgi:competence protein ComEC